VSDTRRVQRKRWKIKWLDDMRSSGNAMSLSARVPQCPFRADLGTELRPYPPRQSGYEKGSQALPQTRHIGVTEVPENARNGLEIEETNFALRGSIWVDTRGTTLERKDEKPRKKYRERAVQMLRLAKQAHTEAARSSYINLAASWGALARRGDHNPQKS
jgi:hypothetical protein